MLEPLAPCEDGALEAVVWLELGVPVVVTDCTVPSAAVTVVVTVPFALVTVAVLVVVEAELPPDWPAEAEAVDLPSDGVLVEADGGWRRLLAAPLDAEMLVMGPSSECPPGLSC